MPRYSEDSLAAATGEIPRSPRNDKLRLRTPVRHLHGNVRKRHGGIHVRDRDREQLPDHRRQGRQDHPRRRDGASAGTTSAGTRTFDLVQDLGIEYLRYGPPYYNDPPRPRPNTTGASPTKPCTRCKRDEHHAHRRPVPLRRPRLGRRRSTTPTGRSCFAEYARAFAERFPWVRLYTPVNEIFVAATFSGTAGLVERAADQRPRLRRRAARPLQGQRAGDAGDPGGAAAMPTFIQSESSEYFHADEPKCIEQAAFLNERRFLSLDLTYGRTDRRRHVRVPAGQRHDPRRVPLVPRPPRQSPLRHGQRLLRHQRAPRQRRRQRRPRRAKSSATT